MLTRTRTTMISLVASLSFAGAAVAPGAAQAIWHNYCVKGVCTTHGNYKVGGVDPCTAINAQSDGANHASDIAAQEKAKADKMAEGPAKTAAEAAAEADAQAADAASQQADRAAFEWGCDTTGLHTT